jgi:hypothetical protein
VVAPASVLMVTQSFERMSVGPISIPPLVMPPGIVGHSSNPESEVPTTGPAATSSKCTQTKVC